MSNPLKDVFNLFFPECCAVCGSVLPDNENFICTRCRWEIPLTRFWEGRRNPVISKFSGNLPLVNASSFFYFVHESDFRGLIHKFKYRGGWKIAEKMGQWFGVYLKESEIYDDIDLIVPVPLHFRRLLARGYNQSEYVAKGISKALGVPIETSCVRRHKYNDSQTRRSRNERWNNVEGIFSLKNKHKLHGKHILLVDDVLTTGATLVSCGEAILKNTENCRLSIVTLAVTKNEI